MTYQELNNYILNYSKNDKTNSAIMLTGGWGTGKSYYIKHSLNKELLKSGKDSVIISLYGIKELSQISQAIYHSVKTKQTEKSNSVFFRIKKWIIKEYEAIINKFYKGTKETINARAKIVANSILTSIAGHYDINLQASEKDLNRLYKSLNFSNYLLIFEDVERASIDIIELFGYINNLVEQDGVKVLLICNESEFVEVKKDDEKDHKKDLKKETLNNVQQIKSQFDTVYEMLKETRENSDSKPNDKIEYSDKTKDYLRIKEKTISDTLFFKNDLNKTVSEIIGDFKNRNLDEFSDENTVNELLNIYVKEKFNLRTFIFACQKTVNIFNALPQDILNNNDFCKTIFYSIVYYSFFIKTAGNMPEWDGDEYCSRVLGTDNYPLYYFCYLYIKGQVLNIESAERSLNHFTKNKLFFSDAFYQNNDIDIIESYYCHSKDEVLKSLESLKQTLETTTIPFTKYGKVIRSLVRFHKLFDYDYNEIKDSMKKWVKEYSDDIEPHYKFGLFVFPDTFKSDEEKYEYEEYIKDLLSVVTASENSNTIDFDYMPESVLNFSRQISNNPYMYHDGKGFLSRFDIDKLFNMIKKCNSSQLYQLQTMFVKIYANNDPDMYGVDNIVLKEKFEIDLEPLKLLSKKIEQLTSTFSDDEIIGEWYDRLNKYLKRIISIIESEE